MHYIVFYTLFRKSNIDKNCTTYTATSAEKKEAPVLHCKSDKSIQKLLIAQSQAPMSSNHEHRTTMIRVCMCVKTYECENSFRGVDSTLVRVAEDRQQRSVRGRRAGRRHRSESFGYSIVLSKEEFPQVCAEYFIEINDTTKKKKKRKRDQESSVKSSYKKKPGGIKFYQFWSSKTSSILEIGDLVKFERWRFCRF